MYLVDYIGKTGVVTSADVNRKPQEGDLIMVRPCYQQDVNVPLVSARIAKSNDNVTYWAYDAGVFWWGPGSVDISGGPFGNTSLPIIRHASHTAFASFWNFGDKGVPIGGDIGSSHRVDYMVNVPVWTVDYSPTQPSD